MNHFLQYYCTVCLMIKFLCTSKSSEILNKKFKYINEVMFFSLVFTTGLLLVLYFSVYNPLLFTPWKAWCGVYNECGLYIVEVLNCKRTFFILVVKCLLISHLIALFFLLYCTRPHGN